MHRLITVELMTSNNVWQLKRVMPSLNRLVVILLLGLCVFRTKLCSEHAVQMPTESLVVVVVPDFSHLCDVYVYVSNLCSTFPQILHRITCARPFSVHSLFVRRSHLLPDQLPRDHTGMGFLPQYVNLRHPGRSMVVGHVPMICICSFICTNHLLWVEEHSGMVAFSHCPLGDSNSHHRGELFSGPWAQHSIHLATQPDLPVLYSCPLVFLRQKVKFCQWKWREYGKI